MITPYNLIVHELIGLKVRVIRATCPEMIGIEGEIRDETKNLLIIRTSKGIKKVPKKDCTFLFFLPGGKRVLVDGKLIAFRPEERTKKAWKHRREVSIL